MNSPSDSEMIASLNRLGLWEKLRDVIHRPDVLGRMTTGILGHWFQDFASRWLREQGFNVVDISDSQMAHDIECNGVTVQMKVTGSPDKLNLMRNGHNYQYMTNEWQVLVCMSLCDDVPLIIPVSALLDPKRPGYVVKSLKFSEFGSCRGDISVFCDPESPTKLLAIQQAVAVAMSNAESDRQCKKRGVQSFDMFDTFNTMEMDPEYAKVGRDRLASFVPQPIQGA